MHLMLNFQAGLDFCSFEPLWIDWA